MRGKAVVMGAVALAAACNSKEGGKTGDSAVAVETAVVQPTVVTIVAKDFAYEAPDTITGGMVTLRLVNQGPELHHLQLIQIGDGHTYAEFVEGMKSMKPDSPMPSWLHEVAGPNAPAPGGEQSLTEELQPGTYAIVCFIPSADHMPHAMKGMMKELTVVPNTGQVTVAPVADVTVKMSDYAWDITPQITAGKHIMKIENLAAQPHEMLLVRLNEGKTPMDLAKWVDNQVGAPPATPMGGISGMATGGVVYVPVELTPGEYGVLCFLPDAKDGKPHVTHGMMKQFTVL